VAGLAALLSGAGLVALTRNNLEARPRQRS
jgi:hypothetical protein